VGRCLVVVVGVATAPDSGLLVFCAGQLTFSVSYALIYYGYFTLHIARSHPHSLPIHTMSHILPSPASDKTWFSKDALTLSWSFFKQSFLKQFLTNGERYVMTIFGVLTFAQQGVYDIIHNLGSMVARFIFLPIEENFYVFFASVLYRGELPARQREGAVVLSATTLTILLKFVLHVALTILCFGYSYSFLALDIYGGSLLSDGEGPTLLRWYCVYVFMLAVNGVTECFVFAAMSQSQVDR
jgi:oligosaccharide translocation protein RFT1